MKWLNAIGRFIKNAWPAVVGLFVLIFGWLSVRRTDDSVTRIGTIKNNRSQEDLDEAQRIRDDVDRLP